MQMDNVRRRNSTATTYHRNSGILLYPWSAVVVTVFVRIQIGTKRLGLGRIGHGPVGIHGSESIGVGSQSTGRIFEALDEFGVLMYAMKCLGHGFRFAAIEENGQDCLRV